MKKILYLFLLVAGLSSTPQNTHAQWIVNDPAHMSMNLVQWGANASAWVEQINSMLEAARIREGLQSIAELKQLESLVELAGLIDDVACLSSDYNFYINLGSNYHCLKFLNFQSVMVNLNISTDLLFKVTTISNLFSMNSEGRLAFISQVRESLEQSMKDMKKFNETVRSRVIGDAMKHHTKKTYFSGKLAAYNRYKLL